MNPFNFLIPLAVVFLTQVIKILVETIKNKQVDLKNIYAYGGMPSSHAAFVLSLLTLVYLEKGIYDISFAIALVLAILIIRDAFSLRNLIGKQAATLNKLVAKLPKTQQKDIPEHETRVGHTAPQLVAGSIIGCLLTLILYACLIVNCG